MFTEEFILGAVLCAVLFLLGYIGRLMPLRVLSSLGLMYLAFNWYGMTQDVFGLGMMIAIAFALVFVGRGST